MQFAYVKNEVIESFGALPHFWSVDGIKKGISLHELPVTELKELGWLQIIEVGKRSYDVDIETQMISSPELFNGSPVMYYTYAYLSNYKEIMAQRVTDRAKALSQENNYAMRETNALEAQHGLNPQEQLIIESTKKFIAANAKYKRDVAESVEFAGVKFQSGHSTISKLTSAVAAYSAVGKTPAEYYWLDINNVRRPASLEFITDLLIEMTNKNFEAFTELTNSKEETRETLLRNLE